MEPHKKYNKREYDLEWHRKNRARDSNRCKEWRLSNRIFIQKYLGYKCQKCGYDEVPAILEIHHPNGVKNKDWDWYANRNKETIVKILAEEKVLLLCPNCHAIQHLTTSPLYDRLMHSSKRLVIGMNVVRS